MHDFLEICAITCNRFNHVALLLLVVIASHFSTPVFCDDLTETSKLTAPDAAASDLFGESVSISDEYAIVGAVGGDSDLFDGTGAAYIFQRSGGDNWSTPRKVVAPDGVANDKFGTSVSVDGNYAIVGSPFDTNTASNSGSAYIFTYPFTDQPVKLIASDGAARDVFGYSVSISGDYAIVGAPTILGVGSGPGAAYIFQRQGSAWVEVEILVPPPGDGAEGDLFGYSVAISGDHAIVGAPGHGDEGAVYDFSRTSEGAWEQNPLGKLVPPGNAVGAQAGWSVAIDGNSAIMGGPTYDGDAGDNSGAAWVLWREAGTLLVTERLEAADSAAGDQFGYSVSLSENHAVVGTLRYLKGAGAAYVFQTEEDVSFTSDWIQADRLIASDTSPWWFGTAVALFQNRALVGAKGDNVNGPSSGSVYSFNIFAEPDRPLVGLPPGVILLLLEE